MSETKWEKDSWRMEPLPNHPDVIFIFAGPEEEPKVVAGLSVQRSGMTLETTAGNACLIAAAPELYEALEELLKYGKHPGRCENCYSHAPECDSLSCTDGCRRDEDACSLHIEADKRREERARAVLAKARGETAV